LKSFLKLLILIFIIILSVFMALFLFFNRPADRIPEEGAEFEIINRDSSYSIAKRLLTDGYINSREFFIFIPRLFKLDKNLQVGCIKINSKDSTVEILKKIYLHEYITVSFTIPEGSTLEQVKKILLDANIVNAESLDEFFSRNDYISVIGLSGYKSMEGFLFPETYKFYRGVKPATVFKGMTSLFFKKLEEINPNYRMMNKEDLYDKIILASIVEREVKLKAEASIVAGVFYNRLKKRMRLQSCATIQYVLGKQKEYLTDEDLEIESPYNSYKHSGLPPTAISNPGFNALKASFFPAQNNYLFFVVADPGKGTHHFSENYDEHLTNQQIYKKSQGIY